MNSHPFQTETMETPSGPIPVVSTNLTKRDRFGEIKARIGIGRMRYSISPGLYAIGHPTDESPVFVSANYKMSFDRLRSNLAGFDCWILVLDTHGINVWCAAGKGTFGTDELAKRVERTGLATIVSHRKLVVPQLGAVGVSAHELFVKCGFKVHYGPIRAPDIARFMESGMKATPAMRRVEFPMRDRAALIPLEIIAWGKYALLIAALLFVLGGISGEKFSLESMIRAGLPAATIFIVAYLIGGISAPILLPWLPGRAFALKGLWVGLVSAGALIGYSLLSPGTMSALHMISWAILIPTVMSFMAMNFTGSTTFTSLSGVRREMKYAVPIQLAGLVLGLALWIVGTVTA